MVNSLNDKAGAQDAINAEVYHDAKVVRYYQSEELARAEVCALLKYQHAFADRDVLDIGIGTGRTTSYLVPLARRYEGFDYSPVMVEQARSNFPGASIKQADMRDLSAYPTQSFDFVLATNNVFDAVSDADRLKALAETQRVMRSGAVLMFSAHNRQYERALGGPRLARSRNPATQAMLVLQFGRQLLNHRRIGKLRQHEAHYALLNDEGHDFACLHYYIDRSAQAAQLAEAGFELIDVFDFRGVNLKPADLGTHSPWLMYVARKTS